MINCSKCGHDNSNESKFCENCGNSLQNNNSINQQTNKYNFNETENNQQKEESKTKKICLGIIVIVILLAIVGALFGNSSQIKLEEIEAPTGFVNISVNKTDVIFMNKYDDAINVKYNDKEEDVSKLPYYLENNGHRIIKENKYTVQNYEVNEIIYSDNSNLYANLYFINFNDKWYTINYVTDHINYGVTNANNPVNQVINSMINQYQS